MLASVPDSSASVPSLRLFRSLLNSLLCVVMLLAALPAQAQFTITGEHVPQLASYDSEMESFMRARNVKSGQIAVVWQGRLVYSRGFTLDPGPKDIITQPDSLFRIASCSKPITAFMIHTLIQSGQLSLDSRLSDFVDLTPQPPATADSKLADITVRDLMEHLGGWDIGLLGYDPTFYDAAIKTALGLPGYPLRREHIIRYQSGKLLNHTPRTTYAYSNYGYMLLGEIIEAVTGESYENYARDQLRKLGIWNMRLAFTAESMRHHKEPYYHSIYSGTSVVDDSGATVSTPYGAINYRNIGGAGSWIASAQELARWLATLHDPTLPGAILSQSQIDTMLQPPQVGGGSSFHAQGWLVAPTANGRTIWYNGSLPGTSAFMAKFDNGYIVAALINTRDEAGQGSFHAALNAITNAAYAGISGGFPQHDLTSQMLPIFGGDFETGDTRLFR